jgi:hypothetical protein
MLAEILDRNVSFSWKPNGRNGLSHAALAAVRGEGVN